MANEKNLGGDVAVMSVTEARERLDTQIQCFADEIRAWGCAMDARIDPAIDALIAAVRADQERGQAEALTVCGICGEPSATEVCKGCA